MSERAAIVVQPETVAAAHGVAGDSAFGTVAPLIYLSSTCQFADFNMPGAVERRRRRW
jgi:cystathionine gamma-synthase